VDADGDVRLDPTTPPAEELEDPDRCDTGFDDPSPADDAMELEVEPTAEQPRERPRWESALDDLLHATAEVWGADGAYIEGPEHRDFVDLPRFPAEVPTPDLAPHSPVDARSEASDIPQEPDWTAMPDT
jgi:hypothetical protein